jgi:hypothetical protein
MLIWLLVLLLLIVLTYVVYRFSFHPKKDIKKGYEKHYTFKL